MWVQGFANPHSELLRQETFTLEPGASAFLDLSWDIIAGRDENRHQVRATVTVLDDEDSACAVTLEVFDNETGQTAALLPVSAGPDNG